MRSGCQKDHHHKDIKPGRSGSVGFVLSLNQKVAGLIPDQGAYLDCGFDARLGSIGQTTDCVSFSHQWGFVSPHSSFSKSNGKYIYTRVRIKKHTLRPLTCWQRGKAYSLDNGIPYEQGQWSGSW